MNSYTNYKKVNSLAKKLFKYSDEDIVEILVKNHARIEEFYTLSPQEITEYIKKINHEKIAETLLDSLTDYEIDNTLESLQEYDIKDIVIDNFSYNARELQLETISKIYDAIEKGYKFIILEAISGFGKSLIANALTRIYSEGKSYILTTTNQLVNQYAEDFKSYDTVRLNPRSTYDCKKNGGKCNPYFCKYRKCDKYIYSNSEKSTDEKLSCNYLYQLKEGLKSDSVVCTYDYFIPENFYHSSYLKPRKLLICDEGHNIDDKVSQAVSLQVPEGQFSKELKLNKSAEYKYLKQKEDYYYYLLKFKKTYEQKIKDKKEGSGQYIKLKKRLDDINKFMEYFDSNENLTFNLGNKKEWIFKPVKVNKIIKDALLNYGDICIFMSSSIFDHENFAFDLGIAESEIYSIRVPNTFDQSNNPINICPKFNMEGEPTETGTAEKSLDTINYILNMHSNEKGIIHTSNKKQVEYLMNNLNTNRIISHKRYNREAVLNNFKNSEKPLVLISPSMNEGVDLPDDLCRFQIIFKLPYLPIDDSWVNKRKNLYEDSKEWYEYKMLTKLIQTHGRGIRSENDYCKTYILDNRLFDVINKDLDGNEIIPKYFINSIENFDLD